MCSFYNLVLHYKTYLFVSLRPRAQMIERCIEQHRVLSSFQCPNRFRFWSVGTFWYYNDFSQRNVIKSYNPSVSQQNVFFFMIKSLMFGSSLLVYLLWCNIRKDPYNQQLIVRWVG